MPAPDQRPRQAEDVRLTIEVPVPEVVVELHPVVARTSDSLRVAKPGEDGRVAPRAKSALPVKFGPANIDRAVRILDALIKGLELRNHRIETEGEEGSRKMTAVVANEKIPIAFDEEVAKEVRELTAREKQEQQRNPWRYRDPQYRYFPSGKLSLRIDVERYLFSGLRRRWTDSEQRPRIEKCLGAFVEQLETIAGLIKEDRRKREEDERKRREWEELRHQKLQLIHEEEERVKTLDAQVDNWHRSQRIRHFVQAVRENRGEIDPDSELGRWLDWSSKQADRWDPLAKSPPSLLDEKQKWASYLGWRD